MTTQPAGGVFAPARAQRAPYVLNQEQLLHGAKSEPRALNTALKPTQRWRVRAQGWRSVAASGTSSAPEAAKMCLDHHGDRKGS